MYIYIYITNSEKSNLPNQQTYSIIRLYIISHKNCNEFRQHFSLVVSVRPLAKPKPIERPLEDSEG